MRISEASTQFNKWKQFDCKETTVKGYALIIKQFAVFMRNCDIEDVQMNDILDWFTLMQDLQWDRNSFITKAIALRKFFEFFAHQGYEVIDPFLIPVPNKQYKIPRVADEDSFERLINVIPENNDPRHIRNKAIVNLLWDTGARNGEICSLNMDDMDYVTRRAVIHTEKTRGARPIREIFWTPKSNDHLLRWTDKREQLKEKMKFIDDHALFISICSGGVHHNAGKRLQNKGLGEMLRRYSNRAKMPNLNAHSFRHHMGHHIVKQGGSNSDVSNILGHSNLQSSYIYTQMNNVELQERYKRFMNI